MAKKQITKATRISTKKKKWIKAFAPAEVGNVCIGEILCETPEQLIGRAIKTDLGTLTANPKKQHINLKFKITKIKENQAITTLQKYEIQAPTIKRFTRKGKDKIDFTLVEELKDNIKAIIKVYLLTKNKTVRSVKKALTTKITNLLKKELKSKTFSEILSDTLSGKLQNSLKLAAKKIYPVKMCEIRVLEKV